MVRKLPETDLELAIMQADDYRHYRHATPHSKLWMTVYKPIGEMFTKNCSGCETNKSRAGLPLAPFIRNRQSGVLGRPTFKKAKPGFAHYYFSEIQACFKI